MSTATSPASTASPQRGIPLLETQAPAAVIVVRLMPGTIFLLAGIQKFLFPEEYGTGRFETIGIPAPRFFGPFAGAVEIICGVLLLVGLFARFAAIPMIVNMLLALALTKIPILWGGSAASPEDVGFWDFAHASRLDVAMLLSVIFLLIVGGGRWSLDALLTRGARGRR